MRTFPKPFRLFFALLLSVMLTAAAIPPLTVFAEPAEYTIPAGQTIILSSIPDTADVKLAGSATIRIDCNKTLNSITYAGSNYKADTLTLDQMGPSRSLHVSGDVVVPNLTVDASATSIYFENDLYVQRSISDHGESGTALFKNGELHIWGGVYFGKKMEVSSPAYVTVGEGVNTWSTSIGASYTQTGGTMLICQVAVLSHRFQDGAARGRAFGAWGIAFGVGLGFSQEQIDAEAEAERLLALGAKRKPWRYEPGADYTVLTDPDGNPFCVVQK